jgi:5-deoxy-D-glucuronate isomerase
MLAGRAGVAAGKDRWDSVGGRASVFSGMPHALYLPTGLDRVEIEALGEPARSPSAEARPGGPSRRG